ncbi:MAG: DUF2281 domain-containing protein [Methylococcaceae bacterium]|nr:DUF2281 domain-containing protein [Methylococcaceae bacterium]
MNTAELIYQESKELPEFEAQEVLDFVAFLKQKVKTKQDTKPNKESLFVAFDLLSQMPDDFMNDRVDDIPQDREAW